MNNRHILAICNTYYQLFVAMQLKRTRYKDDRFTVILSDHSRNAKKTVERLNRETIFTKVYFAQTKKKNARFSGLQRIATILDYFLFKKKRPVSTDEIGSVDEYLFYNNGLFENLLYITLIKKNKSMICRRFEEGVLSYPFAKATESLENGKIRKLLNGYLHWKKLQTLYEKTDSFYCFYPELYGGELRPMGIEQIHCSDELIDQFQRIFTFDKETVCYDKKYIYFASSIDSDCNIQVEFDLVEELSSLIGKENMLVKTHPRDVRGIYEDHGYCIDKNSAIPWEALQFCINPSKTVFLSTFSGSILSCSGMLDDDVETYYLYKLCNCDLPFVKMAVDALNETITKLQKLGKCNKVTVINDFKEIAN